MSDQLTKLTKKIEAIEGLKTVSSWGPEYQLWVDLTERLVEEMFGVKGLKLFQQQSSVVLDEDAYLRELTGRKRILEGLIENQDEYRPDMKGNKATKEPTPVDMFETKINTIKLEHPFWFWFTAIGTLVGIVTGSMFLAQYFGVLPYSLGNNLSVTSINETTATSTLPLSDLLSKALTLETVIERQDFLKKYIGSTVSVQGVVTEVSRSGSGFLIDMKVNG